MSSAIGGSDRPNAARRTQFTAAALGCQEKTGWLNRTVPDGGGAWWAPDAAPVAVFAEPLQAHSPNACLFAS
jgi:hypothetical protein